MFTQCFFSLLLFAAVSLSNSFSAHQNVLRKASLIKAPYHDIKEYLSEHIQPTDEMLLIGAKSDLSQRLIEAGYGLKKFGSITVIDESLDAIEESIGAVKDNDVLSNAYKNKLIKYINCKYDDLKDVCKQSIFDSIIDYCSLDELIKDGATDRLSKCIDFLQNSLRVGNIFVGFSKYDKDRYCQMFDDKFGESATIDKYHVIIHLFRF